MALEAGKDLVLLIDDAGDSQRTMTGFVLAFRGNFPGHKLIDVTVMGSSGHIWASDELEDNSFEVDFLFDPTASTGPWALLKSIRAYATARDFEIGPYGNTGGYEKISGTCFLENMPLEVALGDMIKLSGCAFKVNGVATFGTF